MIVYVFGTRGFPKIQGGVEKHCEFLYPKLSEKFNISIFRRKAFLTPDSPKKMGTINFIDLPSTKIKGFESFFHSFLCTIYCLIKRPDIIHIHNIGPGIFIPFLKLFKLKVILTYHSPNYEHKKWGFFARFILKTGELFSLKGANTIIFVNKKQMLSLSLKTKNKSVFIPNGIVKQAPARKTNYIDHLQLSPQKYILAVGRITQEKGFDYLIDAYILLQNPNYKLVIAGGIDHNSLFSNQFKKKAQENNIILTGYIEGEELQQLYSHAKLFVLPSYNEGYPIVLLEAINYHLPILASDISANKQINLPMAAYFPVGDSFKLKEKMEYALQNSLKLTEYNQSLFTWEDISRQVEEIYNKVYKVHK